MKAISIRAPWWWFILYGSKDVENRSRGVSYRGRVAVQASKWWDEAGVLADVETARQMGAARLPTSANLLGMRALGGHVVGTVEITDVVTKSPSRWFVGPVGLVISRPTIVRPIAAKGAVLTLFDLPPDISAALEGR